MALTAKERKKKQRDKERDQSVTISHENVTLEKRDTISVTEVHPVVKMLSDPLKRAKLRAICNSLSNHGMLGNVTLGYPGYRRSISMLEVSELLEAF